MKAKKRIRRTHSLTPAAFYTALFGLNLLAIAICDTAIRTDAAISHNPNLIGCVYIPALEYVLGGLVVLTGGVLLIDYIQRH